MLDSNYSLGFYLIEKDNNHYDLYNSVTDKCILMEQPKDKVVSFLEINSPNHPFLNETVESTDYSLNDFNKIGNVYYASVPMGEDIDMANYNSYYSSADYTSGGYCNSLVSKEEPEQLEFSFTYDGNNNNKLNKTIRELEDEIPYLGDNED